MPDISFPSKRWDSEPAPREGFSTKQVIIALVGVSLMAALVLSLFIWAELQRAEAEKRLEDYNRIILELRQKASEVRELTKQKEEALK